MVVQAHCSHLPVTPGVGGKAHVVSQSVHSRSKLRAALNDVLGGCAASVLTVTFCMSYALLIFSGPLTPYLSYGVAVTFISSAVIATVLAFGSSIPFAVGGPESSTSAMTAILASSLLERMAASSQASPVVPVLITFGLASIATGIVLYCFGVTRMGRTIRYLPYPVVGGFLGATGCLILLGAVRVITGMRLQFATLGQFANLLTLSELGAACVVALILYLTWRRSRSPFGLPVILIGGVIAAHVMFWLAGLSPIQAQASGWTFPPPPNISLMLPWSAMEIR
ncbi:MAG: SulP family inorganic anion transporter, partial [Bradyrhizobium sp.]|nr:SulP family inorganic anion transporter [Bradyrhizobium sp.]